MRILKVSVMWEEALEASCLSEAEASVLCVHRCLMNVCL